MRLHAHGEADATHEPAFPTTDRPRATATLALLAALLVTEIAWAEHFDPPRFPSISPDGQEVVISWRGDLWKVSAAGGRAVRLTSHPANELSSAWSPDGAQIAFESDRDGYRNFSKSSSTGA